MASLAGKMGVSKIRVQRVAERLKQDKLAEVFRNRLRLTSKGERELGDGNE
jgi:Mn-dependent DtxR family transcriptional regulator